MISIDLHAAQIQGFFNIPIDNFPASSLLAETFIDTHSKENIVVVSPDHGGVTRARMVANVLGAPLAIIDKRRPKPNVAEIQNIIGDVKGMRAIMIDDMIDTAGTTVGAANAAMEKGAKSVTAIATHGVLSGPAIERLKSAPIKNLVVTDTIRIPEEKILSNMKIITVADVFGAAINRIHNGESVSALFEF